MATATENTGMPIPSFTKRGTRTVAPNIAKTCWSDNIIQIDNGGRSRTSSNRLFSFIESPPSAWEKWMASKPSRCQGTLIALRSTAYHGSSYHLWYTVSTRAGFDFVRSGYITFKDTLPTSLGKWGYMRSHIAASYVSKANATAFLLYFNDRGLDLSHYLNRYDGFPVRCLVYIVSY